MMLKPFSALFTKNLIDKSLTINTNIIIINIRQNIIYNLGGSYENCSNFIKFNRQGEIFCK